MSRTRLFGYSLHDNDCWCQQLYYTAAATTVVVQNAYSSLTSYNNQCRAVRGQGVCKFLRDAKKFIGII